MKLRIRITKGAETLIHRSVTATEIPQEILTVFYEVSGCEMSIRKED